MPSLDEFKTKYAAALQAVQEQGVSLSHLHVQDNKLVMQGAAPNDAAKNKVWDAIKSANPAADDINCDLTIDSSLPAPSAAAPAAAAPAAATAEQTYTVKPGDSLWKISKEFYGEGHLYTKIFDANRDQMDDPNVLQPGWVLKIPAA